MLISAQRPTTAILLAISLALSAAVTQTNCQSLTVKDPVTGLERPATPQEIAQIYGQTAAKAGEISTAFGFPQAAPILSLIGQMAALWAAWSIRPKEPKTTPPPNLPAVASK